MKSLVHMQDYPEFSENVLMPSVDRPGTSIVP